MRKGHFLTAAVCAPSTPVEGFDAPHWVLSRKTASRWAS